MRVMLKRYKENEILAAWRRRRGLTSGWTGTGTEVLPEYEASVLIELWSAYLQLLRESDASLVPCENFSEEEITAEYFPEGRIRVRLPERMVRLLEIELDTGEIINSFRNCGEGVALGLLRELTGGMKRSVAELNGDIAEIASPAGSRIKRLRGTAYPDNGDFVLSPELLTRLFEINNQ